MTLDNLVFDGPVKRMTDQDLYKFSMSNAYMRKFPCSEGVFEFCDRNHETCFTDPEMFNSLKRAFASLSTLKLTDEEFEWCKTNIPYIPASYWEWLRQFRYDPEKIVAWVDDEGYLQIHVADNLYKVTLYEVPILAIVSEIRNSYLYKWNRQAVIDNIIKKIDFANAHNLKFAEFGTRRRYNYEVQEIVVEHLANECRLNCTGTSNVFLAMKYNMKPIGTMAHEWIMFHGGVFGFQQANYLALENWTDVYDGDLGTALIDTYGTDSFLETLTMKQAKLLDGFRQDSGDPTIIGNKIIKRLKEFGIDPKTKLIIFSNALTMDSYNDINTYFDRKVIVGAGIGGHLTNDMPDIPDYVAPNIVMKLMKVRLSPHFPYSNTVKLSDDKGKTMGDPEIVNYCKKILNIKD